MSLESIQKRIEEIEKFEEENRIAKETLNAQLDESSAYGEALNEAKLATKKKKQIKDEIFAQSANQDLLDTISENNEEISTLREILSTELIEYHQKQKVSEITDASGQLRKFKLVVKLDRSKKISFSTED